MVIGRWNLEKIKALHNEGEKATLVIWIFWSCPVRFVNNNNGRRYTFDIYIIYLIYIWYIPLPISDTEWNLRFMSEGVLLLYFLFDKFNIRWGFNSCHYLPFEWEFYSPKLCLSSINVSPVRDLQKDGNKWFFHRIEIVNLPSSRLSRISLPPGERFWFIILIERNWRRFSFLDFPILALSGICLGNWSWYWGGKHHNAVTIVIRYLGDDDDDGWWSFAWSWWRWNLFVIQELLHDQSLVSSAVNVAIPGQIVLYTVILKMATSDRDS